MDPKLFLIMIILLTFLENCSSVRKVRNTSLIQKRPYRGVRRFKVPHRTTRDTISNHYGNRRTRDIDIYQSDNTEGVPKDIFGVTHDEEVTDMMRFMNKGSNYKNLKRAGRDETHDTNENIESSTTENYATDITNSVEETQQPQKPSRKNKRMKKKQNKKYNPQFQYLKIKNKKRTKLIKLKPDIPDKAEDVLDIDYPEASETKPTKTAKEKRKKGKKNKKQYYSIGEKNDRNKGDTRALQKRYQKIKAGHLKRQKNNRKNPIRTSTRKVEDYVEETQTEDMEDTTKHMKQVDYERTEVIYLTPIPRHMKYKPEFRYIPIDSDPHNRNSYGEQYYEPHKLQSSSKETEETESNQKKDTNWDENKHTNNQEDSDDDGDEADSSESSSERKTRETEESDEQDHIKLQIRRTAEEKWDDLDYENVKHPNNIKSYNGVKKARVIRYVLHKTNNIRNKNVNQEKFQIIPYEQDAKTDPPNNDDKEIKNTTTRIIPYVKEQDAKTISLKNDDKETASTTITTNTVAEEPDTSIASPSADDNKIFITKSITFEEVQNQKYEPASLYSIRKKQLQDKGFEIRSLKRSTRDVRTSDMVTEDPQGSQVTKTVIGIIEHEREIIAKAIESLTQFLENSKLKGTIQGDMKVKRSPVDVLKVIQLPNIEATTTNKSEIVQSTNQPEETTAMDDYGETSAEPDKDVSITASYQVTENIINIPDDKIFSVILDYDKAENRKSLAILHKQKKEFDRLNPISTENGSVPTEHPIANIVQGMKDYLNVVGTGIFNTVKDIFKEQSRRRRSVSSQENNIVNLNS